MQNTFGNIQKRFFFYKIFAQILIAVVPLADTIIPKYIIDELTGEKRADLVFMWVAILLGINLLGNWCINYLSGTAFLLIGRVFTEFQTMLSDQLSRCDYERLEDPKFLDSKMKAERFLYANGQGFAGVLDTFFNIFSKIFTFAGIVAIISTLNIWVVLAFIAVITLNSYFDHRVRKKSIEWDLEKIPIERRTTYGMELINNFAFGKEIRLYGLRGWIVDKIREQLKESEKFYEKQTKLSNKASYVAAFTNFLLKGVTYVYFGFQGAWRRNRNWGFHNVHVRADELLRRHEGLNEQFLQSPTI